MTMNLFVRVGDAAEHSTQIPSGQMPRTTRDGTSDGFPEFSEQFMACEADENRPLANRLVNRFADPLEKEFN